MIAAGMVAAVLLGAGAVKSQEEIGSFLTYYYLDPKPVQSLDYLEPLNTAYQEAKGLTLADVAERGGIRSFYAAIFASSPEAVREIERRLPDLPVDIRVFVNEAISRCDSAKCERLRGTPFHAPDEPLSPSTLDDHWAAFGATGDRLYVEKIIAALPLLEVRGDVERLLVGGAAKWSLSSNAYQHARVLAICEDAERSAEEPTRSVLKALIEEAKAERASNPPPEPVGSGRGR